jgi:hypothetical protein
MCYWGGAAKFRRALFFFERSLNAGIAEEQKKTGRNHLRPAFILQ